MNTTASDVRGMGCTVIKAEVGWLAVSKPFSPILIGVIGATEADARAAFEHAAEAWARLRELPDPPPPTGAVTSESWR